VSSATGNLEINSIRPVASFSFSPTTGQYPLDVQFNDTSVGSNLQYQWKFETDVQNVTTQNPTYRFSNAGTYTVVMTVTNEFGSSSATGQIVVQSPPPPPDFLPGWNYRKLHSIRGSPDADLTNYPVRLLIYRDGTTSQSGNVIQAGPNVTSDYRDIRFTDYSGTELSYWIESFSSTFASVWVKVSSLPRSGSQIYVYYGNSTATSQSSGSSVFTYFDDFASVGSGWTQSGGVSASNSIVTLSSSGKLVSTQTFGINTAIGTKGVINPSLYNAAGYQSSDERGAIYYSAWPTAGSISAVNYNPYPPATSSSLGAMTGTHVYEVSRAGTGTTTFMIDGTTRATLTQNAPTISLPIYLWAQAGTMTVDSVYVRQATTTEPVSSATGIEEYY
jgi:PKD repeat protein